VIWVLCCVIRVDSGSWLTSERQLGWLGSFAPVCGIFKPSQVTLTPHPPRCHFNTKCSLEFNTLCLVVRIIRPAAVRSSADPAFDGLYTTSTASTTLSQHDIDVLHNACIASWHAQAYKPRISSSNKPLTHSARHKTYLDCRPATQHTPWLKSTTTVSTPKVVSYEKDHQQSRCIFTTHKMLNKEF
jgi:hypothetical protein